MAKKHIDLTATQKDEIRRLTQLANRRIKSAQKVYAKEGMDVLPKEVTGGYQVPEKWHTKTTPLSRSVKFESLKAYRKQLSFLNSFVMSRPTITEYTDVQQDKLILAIETSMGQDAPEDLQQKIKKMTAPQLSQFWDTFSKKATRIGFKYSSNANMTDTVEELFPEDIQGLASNVELPRPSTPIEFR
jgi:hypothetical protein